MKLKRFQRRTLGENQSGARRALVGSQMYIICLSQMTIISHTILVRHVFYYVKAHTSSIDSPAAATTLFRVRDPFEFANEGGRTRDSSRENLFVLCRWEGARLRVWQDN
jgi:hypothetical protein